MLSFFFLETKDEKKNRGKSKIFVYGQAMIVVYLDSTLSNLILLLFAFVSTYVRTYVTHHNKTDSTVSSGHELRMVSF